MQSSFSVAAISTWKEKWVSLSFWHVNLRTERGSYSSRETVFSVDAKTAAFFYRLPESSHKNYFLKFSINAQVKKGIVNSKKIPIIRMKNLPNFSILIFLSFMCCNFTFEPTPPFKNSLMFVFHKKVLKSLSFFSWPKNFSMTHPESKMFCMISN